jgi:hypothetical protein
MNHKMYFNPKALDISGDELPCKNSRVAFYPLSQTKTVYPSIL